MASPRAPVTDYRDMKSDSVARLILETVKEDSKEKRRESKAREKRGDRDIFSRKKDRDSLERRREHVADRHRVVPSFLCEKDKRRRESTEGSRDRKEPPEAAKERRDGRVKPEEAHREDLKEYGCDFGKSLEPWERHHPGREKEKREPRWPLELLRGSQARRRAVCGTRGSLRTMHGGPLPRRSSKFSREADCKLIITRLSSKCFVVV